MFHRYRLFLPVIVTFRHVKLLLFLGPWYYCSKAKFLEASYDISLCLEQWIYDFPLTEQKMFLVKPMIMH
jgi:hypothetical protein